MRDKNQTAIAKPMRRTPQTAADAVRPGDRPIELTEEMALTACDPFATFSEWASEEDETIFGKL